MNEQIKEMAQLMCEDCAASGTHCPTELCDDVVQQAQVLYNAGYRKQSEDTVEVVRCKDCRHCKFNSCSETYKCDRRVYFTETVAEDGFCSYGERKE